jgi:hypothetical protein
MNRQLALALVIATSAAGNAFADDIGIDTVPFRSSASRAEVRAAYIASRDAVAALTREDSGSAAIARQDGAQAPAARVAAAPAKANPR